MNGLVTQAPFHFLSMRIADLELQTVQFGPIGLDIGQPAGYGIDILGFDASTLCHFPLFGAEQAGIPDR